MCDEGCGCCHEDAHELVVRADRIACQVLGHDVGPWREYVYTRLKPVGKSFRWRSCKRCHDVVEGEKPSADSEMSEAVMDVYSNGALKRSVESVSVITRYLRGKSWMDVTEE